MSRKVALPSGLVRSPMRSTFGEGEHIALRASLVPGAITRREWLRFQSYVVIADVCFCQGVLHATWTWIGWHDRDGYGLFFWRGRGYRAHRFAYLALRGSIASPLVPDHLCRIRGCVNPACLEIVTVKVNLLRGESIQAQNARKTHCKAGHSLAENTPWYWGRLGQRGCRICFNKGQLARYHARKLRDTTQA